MNNIVETGCIRCGNKVAKCDNCRFNDSLKELKEEINQIKKMSEKIIDKEITHTYTEDDFANL